MCFAEGRNVAADVGWIDIVYRTSLDSSGTTWGPMRVLHSESTNTSKDLGISCHQKWVMLRGEDTKYLASLFKRAQSP